MTMKKKNTAFLGDLFAGNLVVKTMKVLALVCAFIGIVFAVAAMAEARSGFGYRGFVAYAGIGLAAGVLIYELAEVIRWLQKVYERFDLYDKIDR